jgi:tRNA dimethylallyltransferase
VSGPRPIPAIVGPTASGKSDLGIALALEFDGEVVNLDSVQVYRRLDVATAKVPLSERRGVPHHLIDVVEPADDFTAGDWARAAVIVIEQIEQRGHMPILVGGTGFYLRALTHGLSPTPVVAAVVRQRLRDRLRRRGPASLHRLLRRLDPPAASRLAPADWSRVVRALEVRLATGRSLTEWHRDNPPAPPARHIAARVLPIVLNPPRDELYARIDLRTGKMFAAGLVDEVRALLAAGVPPDCKALGSHGYRRVVEYLEGQRSLESAIEQTRLDTRHYAKRQWSWWRAVPEAVWLDEFGFTQRALEKARLYVVR